ncbi:putative NAD(P)-binding domain-containing protein [Medicago truncatula]|uniref:Putative NAD(P)-binding domain-containing protein n=1 Tax=Medicago truncatula TaxID=3880 RepID=A0A396GD66_MEDTR|nr:putative NAD(P)-binding domain-containing protein [Medicago truncatula]
MISQIHNFKQFSERKFILFKEGFISSVGSLQGVKHLVLLSQLRTGELQDTPGGKQGFTFDKGCAATGSISKEDVAFVCVKALEFVPQTGLIFEVANGENKIPDWKECLATLMEKSSQPPLQ